jgi:hypothetical protein
LSPAHRTVLEEGVAVWERALAEENRRALDQGRALARERGVIETRLPASDQQRFDGLYVRDAENNAAALDRYGIDGRRVLQSALASIGKEGRVSCANGETSR